MTWEGTGRPTGQDDLRAGTRTVVLVDADEAPLGSEDCVRAGETGGAERPAVGGGERLVGFQIDPREVAHGRAYRQGFVHGIGRDGILDRVGSDRRPAQR